MTHRFGGRRSKIDSDFDDDDLRSARGISLAVVLSVLFWAIVIIVILSIYW
jgi:hypothetical protein